MSSLTPLDTQSRPLTPSLSSQGLKATALLSLPNVSAQRLRDGTAVSLSDATLLRLESVETTNGDAFLLVSLGGEVEIPVTATTAVSKQGRQYLISAEDGDGFIRLDLPDKGVAPDQVELFEAALSSWTAFESTQNHEHRGRLVLVDEQTGLVVADLADSLPITQDASLTSDSDSKEPVVVEVGEGGRVRISPLHLTEGYGRSGSKLIGAAEYISRGVIIASDKLSKALDSQAERYVSSRPATDSPLVFSPATKTGVKGVHGFTNQAVRVSGKTAEVVGRFAARVGGSLGRTLSSQSSKSPASATSTTSAASENSLEGTQDSQAPPTGWRGTLNKSLIAFNTLTDSLEASGKHVLSSGHDASVRMTQHRYGDDAAEAVGALGGSLGNVGLVYIDARGIGRRALLKQTGKAAIRARMTDGKQVILAADGSTTPKVQSRSGTPSPSPVVAQK